MKAYIGTKIINAKPMNRSDYNIYRNWALPEDEDGTDEGYLVEYTDGGKWKRLQALGVHQLVSKVAVRGRLLGDWKCVQPSSVPAASHCRAG